EEALQIDQSLGAPNRVASRLHGLAAVAVNQGDYLTGRALAQQSLEILREQDDRGGIALLLVLHGEIARGQGDYERAIAFYEECRGRRAVVGCRGGCSGYPRRGTAAGGPRCL